MQPLIRWNRVRLEYPAVGGNGGRAEPELAFPVLLSSGESNLAEIFDEIVDVATSS